MQSALQHEFSEHGDAACDLQQAEAEDNGIVDAVYDRQHRSFSFNRVQTPARDQAEEEKRQKDNGGPPVQAGKQEPVPEEENDQQAGRDATSQGEEGGGAQPDMALPGKGDRLPKMLGSEALQAEDKGVTDQHDGNHLD